MVNGDEGEPSTFKDRMLVERDPHQLVEGIIISAYAIRRNHAFVYLRGEFALGYERLGRRCREAVRSGFVGKNILGSGFDLEIVVHRGAGAYICGEETGLFESLEGERGMPRFKPPFPAIAGLYAKPTVVNNVETLSTVPHIITMGGEAYAVIGRRTAPPARASSPSRATSRSPGTTRSSSACTFRDLIYGLAGGVTEGRTGSSSSSPAAHRRRGYRRDEHLDAPLDMDFVQRSSGRCSAPGAVMVFDETVDPLLVVWRLSKFFAHESCGKCTPCREGSGWIEKVLYRMAHGSAAPRPRPPARRRLGTSAPGLSTCAVAQTTFCPLGPSWCRRSRA